MCQRTYFPLEKKIKEKFFQSFESSLAVKTVKPEKHQALCKESKKWSLILSSEELLVDGPLLKENALEFAN